MTRLLLLPLALIAIVRDARAHRDFTPARRGFVTISVLRAWLVIFAAGLAISAVREAAVRGAHLGAGGNPADPAHNFAPATTGGGVRRDGAGSAQSEVLP